ncbi:MAG: prepilin-type N-terminal cleavage/methylation domain-containing protein [Akkermansiaceae bacterium]|nr:prepilin-type N-terminal cleavage/methylation domain-containing protein [Armatimonadota bacterium]
MFPTTRIIPCHRTLPRHGFTLIELLIVIAIIALLTAILFPIFASARDKARSVSCLSNQKQIALATLQYGQDYDDTLLMVNTFFFRETIENQMRGTWVNTLQPYVKSGAQTSNGTYNGDPPPSGGAEGIFKCESFNEDLLKKGVDSPNCLGRGASAVRLPPGNWYLAHYALDFKLECTTTVKCTNSGYNGRTGSETKPFFNRAGSYFSCLDMACTRTEPAIMTFGDVKEVARYIYIGEGFTEVFPFPAFVSGKAMEGDLGCGTQFGPHNGGGNYIFLDGHAKWIKGNVEGYLIQDDAGAWYEKYFAYHL